MSPRLILAIAAVLLSTGGIAIKAVTLDGWQIAALRSGIGALTMLILLPEARRRWSRGVILIGVAQAATFILFVHANRLTTAASTIFLQSTAPLFILLLAPRLLGERPKPRDLVFMVALALGATPFFLGLQEPLVSAPDPELGNFLAMLSGVTWALTILGLRWAQVSPGGGTRLAPTTVVCGNVIACLFCLPAALPLTDVSTIDLGVVVYLGTIQIALAYVLLTRSLAHLPALEASLFMLIEPVMNVALVWMLIGERPATASLLGGALILSTTSLRALMAGRTSLQVEPQVEPKLEKES